MTKPIIHLLLVEDNEMDAMVMKKVLENYESAEFHITLAGTISEAQTLSVTNDYDAVLLDLSLPDSFGLDTFEKIVPFNLNKPIIIMSGIDDEELILQTIQKGAQDFIIKGEINNSLYPQLIRFAIERNKQLQESSNPMLIDELTGLYNERGFTFLAQQFFKLASRTELQFHFFYIELLNLDKISEEMTYTEVHLAITMAAKIIQKTFDPLDIIGHTKTNKFSVLALDDGTMSTDAITKKFYQHVDRFHLKNQDKLELEFKVGLVEYDPEQFAMFENLFKKTEINIKKQSISNV